MHRLVITLISILGLSGCALFLPATENPIPTDEGQSERQSDRLIVMLPGRASRGPDFREKGFFEPAQQAGFDVIGVDAHMGYYRERSVVDRLQEDVIQPAREAGYQEIWLLGISLGGMGTALYADYHGETVDGLILIAPYTGADALRDQIAEQGRLPDWDGEADAGEAHERQAWRALQNWINRYEGKGMVVAYGESDSFAPANQLIADALPAEQVHIQPGRHNWDTWLPLWNSIMEQGLPEAVDRGT